MCDLSISLSGTKLHFTIYCLTIEVQPVNIWEWSRPLVLGPGSGEKYGQQPLIASHGSNVYWRVTMTICEVKVGVLAE